jgi:hypothetical protein
MKWITILCVMAMSNVLAQHKTGTRSQDELLKHRVDSVDRLINERINGGIAKIDSATHALYVQVLERTSNIQNNGDTFYSFIISVVTGIIGLIALFVAVNWYSNNATHKREMKDLTNAYKNAVSNQQRTFNSLINNIRKDAAADRKAMEELKHLIELQRKNIDHDESPGDKDEDATLKKRTEILEALVGLYERKIDHIMGDKFYHTPQICTKCGTPIPKEYFSAVEGSNIPLYQATCPRCATVVQVNPQFLA